jgi:deoxyribonuclease IV
MIIGSHVSFGKDGLLGSTIDALSYGANTFMFYTGAPQNTIRKPIDMKKTNEAFKVMKENGIDINNVVCHAPYIINLANKENELAWNFSCSFLKEEINRITQMNIKYIVVHPGNSLKMERNVALQNIADALNVILDDKTKPMILLETMAGKGTECGISTEELKYIINKVILKEKVGVCIDTCHLNDSGVDISNINEYLDEFDKIIGIDKIKCIHLNDSKNTLGGHKDRHENIGFGTIGFNALINVCYLDRLKNIPKILETPYINGNPPYKFEIAMIKDKNFNENLVEDVNIYYKDGVK